MLEILRKIQIADRLVYQNNPSSIIIVDSRNKVISIEQMDRIHRALGMKMFGYHYFISLDGEVFMGRPERAFSCDVEVVLQHIQTNTDSTVNQSPFGLDGSEVESAANVISTGRIFICLEGNTEVQDMTTRQRIALVALCKDIKSRNRNIRSVYSLSEIIPKLNNLGPYVDMNSVRSEINDTVMPAYISTPAGQVSYTFGRRKLFYNPDKPLQGNDVKLLQLYLISLGFPMSDTNGVFTSLTEHTVKNFQRASGLRVTGTMEDADYDAILKGVARLAVKTDYSTYHRILYYRKDNPMKGPDVGRIQNHLVAMKLLPEVTNKFDEATDIAVRTFQRKAGVEPDGTIGPITWKQVLSGEEIKFTRNLRYDAANPMRGSEIKYLQEKIRDLQRRYSLAQISLTGEYDEITYNNIRKIQSLSNLPITGVVDERLFNYLLNLTTAPLN